MFFFSDLLSEAGSHKPFHERSPWDFVQVNPALWRPAESGNRGVRPFGYGMGGRAGVELRHLMADQHPSLDRFVEIDCQPETVLAEEGVRQNVLNPEP